MRDINSYSSPLRPEFMTDSSLYPSWHITEPISPIQPSISMLFIKYFLTYQCKFSPFSAFGERCPLSELPSTYGTLGKSYPFSGPLYSLLRHSRILDPSQLLPMAKKPSFLCFELFGYLCCHQNYVKRRGNNPSKTFLREKKRKFAQLIEKSGELW